MKIDWKIDENASVSDAVNRMVGNKIGALAVSNAQGDVVGIISERDYIGKVLFTDKNAEGTKVSEVCTYGAVNLVSVTLDNPIDRCMRKMLDRNVRHLLVREKETGNDKHFSTRIGIYRHRHFFLYHCLYCCSENGWNDICQRHCQVFFS